MEIIIFVIGLALGLALAGLFLKKRLGDAVHIARSEGQVELALLNERLATATEDVKRLRNDLAESERQGEGLRRQFEAARNECAQLTERASRVPVLEQDLKTVSTSADEQGQQISALHQRLGAADSTITSQLQEIARLTDESRELTVRHDRLLGELQGLNTRFTEVSTTLDAERRQNDEKLALLNEAREQLSNQFKALANEILEEKAKRFTEQNQTNIGQLLEPLKVKLTEFQGKVEEVYVNEGKDRSALAEQVKQLMALNNQLSKDAHNLTSALKGQAKAQDRKSVV